MAIQTVVKTEYGEERSLYIRANNIEVSNHGVASNAKFRGFLNKEAFEAGARSVWELDVEFFADVNLPLWSQAYKALKVENDWGDALDVLE